MAAAIPVVMVAGAVIQGLGAMQQARAAETAARVNAATDARNAVVVQEQAAVEAARYRKAYAYQEGSMIATRGASGVAEEGSPLAVLADSAANARLDSEMIEYKGKLRAMGYYNNATLNRMAAEQAHEQGDYASAAAILQGVGRAGAAYTAGSRLSAGPKNSTRVGADIEPMYDNYRLVPGSGSRVRTEDEPVYDYY